MTAIAICRFCGEPITPARARGRWMHVAITDFYRCGQLPEPLGTEAAPAADPANNTEAQPT